MHIQAAYPGLIGNTSNSCQYLEAPELPEITEDNVPQSTAESTFQLPFGQSSGLSTLIL